MKFLKHLSLAAFAYVAMNVRADADESAEDDHVVVLTKDNYQSHIDNEKLTLVEYYAPWCGHCKALAPEYIDAAKQLLGEVKLAKVDCTTENDICAAAGIQGYPTLKVFRSGKPSEYTKARQATEIVAYLKKQLLPAVSDVTADNFEQLKTDNKVLVVGYFAKKSGDEYKAFEEVAGKLRDDFVFGVVADKALAKEHEVSKTPGLVLYKSFDEGKVVFDGKDLDVEKIEKFVAVNSVPLVADIGPENYMKYVESGLPLAYAFINEDDGHRKDLSPIVTDLAKKYRGKVNFVFIDAKQFGGHASNLNLKEQWPAFAIQEPEENTKYPFDQEKDLTADNLNKFVDDFVAGNLKPSIKSAPIPESNDEPVKVVVADQFKEIVMDTEKDVLIEFYAPWCGHCKRLAPIYEELAEQLSSIPSIVIAKMDSIDNDLPQGVGFQIEGFPTIKLFKAKTNKVVDFNGDRSLEGFLKFLQDNAEIKFEVPEPKKKEDKKDEDEDEEDDHEIKDGLKDDEDEDADIHDEL
ncbi:hypothetical protein MP228_011060 [Amoeboaphelidium protococcarum]|nr:hypothetical protein MP228_011060 [Amoeboaphelidium protococcarum]